MMIIKENGCVYIAQRAWTCILQGHADNEWPLLEENACLWKVPNEDDIIVALEGKNSFFISDLMRYEPDLIRGELTLDKLVLEFIPDLKDILTEYGKLNKKENMKTQIVFAQKDRAFVITGTFNCNEVEEFETVGRFADISSSALYHGKGLASEERFRFSARTLEQITGANEFPLLAINTKTCKPYLIQRKD